MIPLLAFLLSFQTDPTETIPVYACISVPLEQSTPARYRELAEAGFSTSLTGFDSLSQALRALDAAKGTGVTLFITCPELKSAPAETARRLSLHPALAGYHLQDEPSAADFKSLASWQAAIQAVDTAHPCYINLFPIHASRQQLGTDSYADYVGQFMRIVRPTILSFDNYPTSHGRLEPNVFTNLEIIAAAARNDSRPFWGFYQSVVWGAMPARTLAQLRLESFSNLVYGAQCIQAFTYWMPGFPDHRDAPIGLDGKRTAMYDLVKTVNGEIRAWSRVFKNARVLEVLHAGKDLPPGTRAFRAGPAITRLDAGDGSVVVSFLSKAGRDYVALLNKDLRNPLTVSAAFARPQGTLEIRKDGSDRAPDGVDFRLDPGDLRIFQLPRP